MYVTVCYYYNGEICAFEDDNLLSFYIRCVSLFQAGLDNKIRVFVENCDWTEFLKPLIDIAYEVVYDSHKHTCEVIQH